MCDRLASAAVFSTVLTNWTAAVSTKNSQISFFLFHLIRRALDEFFVLVLTAMHSIKITVSASTNDFLCQLYEHSQTATEKLKCYKFNIMWVYPRASPYLNSATCWQFQGSCSSLNKIQNLPVCYTSVFTSLSVISNLWAIGVINRHYMSSMTTDWYWSVCEFELVYGFGSNFQLWNSAQF